MYIVDVTFNYQFVNIRYMYLLASIYIYLHVQMSLTKSINVMACFTIDLYKAAVHLWVGFNALNYYVPAVVANM